MMVGWRGGSQRRPGKGIGGWGGALGANEREGVRGSVVPYSPASCRLVVGKRRRGAAKHEAVVAVGWGGLRSATRSPKLGSLFLKLL